MKTWRDAYPFFWIILGLLAFGAITSTAKADETILRISIVDTGLDLDDPRFRNFICPDGNKDFTGEGIEDRNAHGSSIAGLIKQYAGNYASRYCIEVLKFWTPQASCKVNTRREVAAIKYAVAHGARIVNISAGGPAFDQEEYEAIRDAARTVFVVAAGNEGQDIDLPGNEYYPASYDLPNIVRVGALNKAESARAKFSNYGRNVQAWEVGEDVMSTFPNGHTGAMSGSSQATAIRTGKMIRAWVTGQPDILNPRE